MKTVTNKANGPRLFHVKAGEIPGADGKPQPYLEQVVLQPGETQVMDLHDEDGFVLSEWKEKKEVEISDATTEDMSPVEVRRGRGRPRKTDATTDNVQADRAITAPFDKAQQDAGAIAQQNAHPDVG